MSEFGIADSLHRLVKEALDSGAAASVEEAQKLFRGYQLRIEIRIAEAECAAHQAALLTCVALARRVFLGGVSISGNLDARLIVPLPLGSLLGDAVTALGGHVVGGTAGSDLPTISIGGAVHARRADFHVRTMFAGWRGGIVPAYSELILRGGPAIPPAAVLAAGLAVNEAFLHVRRESVIAGRRAVGLSLWQPDPTCDWLQDAADEPQLRLLPSRLWLLGLGHLGQAYLWALALLPYSDPSAVHLVLQDVDIITPSTESTSILTDSNVIGQKKTRAMATWLERCGFSTAIYERLFDASVARCDDEPSVALCGLDNALGRRALDRTGFGLVVESGLGRGHQDFRTIRVHTLPGSRSAVEIWREQKKKAEETLISQAAYNKLLENRILDKCGVTLLAGKAVGAPFVGAVAGGLVISEVLRLLHGGALTQLIDLDLESPEHRSVVAQARDFATFNPGYVLARGTRE